MHTFHLRFVLFLLALSIVPGLARAQKPDGDLQPLATSLAAYMEARSSSTGVDAARRALAASLDDLAKKRGGSPLVDPAVLGRAVWLSRAKGASDERPGKVATATFAHGSFAGAGMSYAYRLPREYDASRAYPLLLAIPGENEQPADHIRMSWTLREIQDQVIVDRKSTRLNSSH